MDMDIETNNLVETTESGIENTESGVESTEDYGAHSQPDRRLLLVESVTALYEKYKSNPYMEAKVYNFVVNQLASTLENIERNHQERVQRIGELTTDQNVFIQSFLFYNRFFYHPSTENFFYYDGEHYLPYSEDNVIYNILSTISKDGNLMSWKQKTKVSIMKRIKDNHIYQSIPESATIQGVLGRLYPAVFSTKAAAKYFLTILGDNILKKETSLIHIVSGAAKPLINNLNILCQTWFGTNPCQSFKYKYHAEHNYSQIRMLTSVSTAACEIGLDMLCVACHYSNRYQSSDNYLLKFSHEDALINSVLYLKTLTPDSLVDMFINEYIRVTPASGRLSVGNEVINEIVFKPTQITWKNMYYLWRHFLESKQLPSVVFTAKLKSRLIERMHRHYDADQDLFNGVNSKYLPNVCKFLQFWNETMVEDETEIELEIGEIATLFKMWRGNTTNMCEKQIVDVISYFYPEVEIDDNKFIYKMRNTLWDKQMDIQVAMTELKGEEPISAYDAYVYYCGKTNPTGLFVSKSYFDKFLSTYEI